MRTFRLRTLLIFLSVGGIVMTSSLLLGALLIFQKSNIEDSLLDSNIAYARKLAETTDFFLTMAQNELAWSATQIQDLSDEALLRRETERLRRQSGLFNSVAVVDRNATLVAISPPGQKDAGTTVTSGVSRRAILSQQAFISSPFTSASGNYVVFISQPLRSRDGQYLGYIGGAVYLKKHGLFSDILSQHFNGKYTLVSIVSRSGLIIYSNDPTLVGTHVPMNDTLLRQVATTDSGRLIVNSGGKQFLTGYAAIRATDWNIYIAGTGETVKNILASTVRKAFWFLLIIIVLNAAVVAFLSGRVASPLERLTERIREDGSEAEPSSLASVKGWYHEADRLREAIQMHRHAVAGHLAELHDDAITDPLTGLLNRRGFNILVTQWSEVRELCVVAVDIDHFKKVNDRYGHEAGDAVLVQVATLLSQAGRTGDVVSRFGGEEFIVLLPLTSLDEAARFAERLRSTVASATFLHTGNMTVSAGVASLSDSEQNWDSLLRRADEALYEAKKTGRNAVVVASARGFRHSASAE